MNYYPFHLGDYAANTAHLEPMEDLAYRRMLDLYYRTEHALPSDWRDVARLIRLKDNGKEIEAVLAEFFTLTDAGWVHARCDREIESFKAMVDGGRKGAAKRWGKAGDAPPIATPFPTPTTPQCQPEPKPYSVAKATDGKPSVDKSKKPKTPADRAKADLWKAAVAVLAQGGCDSEPMARSFMGKLVTDYGIESVKVAVDAAVTAQPADAREYLKATCQRHKGERRDPVTVPSDAPEKTLAMLEAQRLTPEQRAASEEARRRVMGALKVVSA